MILTKFIKSIDEIKRLNQDPNTRALINMLEIKQMDEITLRKMAHEEGIEEAAINYHITKPFERREVVDILVKEFYNKIV